MVISRSEEAAKQQQWQSCNWTSPLTFLTLTSRLLSTCLTMCRTKHRSSRWLPSSVFCGQLCWDWRWLVSSAHDQQRVDQTGLLLLGCVWVCFAHISSCHWSVFDSYLPAGFIHLFFEAYFVVNNRTLASSQTLFGQLWKEYSLSDSRYLTSDAFVVCMEAITAFAWGFLAFYIAYCIAVEHPVRYALQLIMSVGQVYGDVLYYATSLLDVSYCRPEGYYFWFYYFFFNLIWMVVGCCESSLFLLVYGLKGCWYGLDYIQQSVVEISKAFKILAEGDVVQKRK